MSDTKFIRADQAKPGMRARMPEGKSFFELVSVETRDWPEGGFSWNGGVGTKLSVGWGNLILDTFELIEIEL